MKTYSKGEGLNGYIRIQKQCMLVLVLALLPSSFFLFSELSREADLLIASFFSSDRFGIPQDYFPMKTTVYFNISVRNNTPIPRNITIYVSVLDQSSVPIGLDQLNTSIPNNAVKYYLMSILIPKWARIGFATAQVSVFEDGKVVDNTSTEFYIGPEDLVPPQINILSPENDTCRSGSIPMIFTVNERNCWLGYNLNDLDNVSITGNTTLTALTNGTYCLTIYANDTSGNLGHAQVYFTVLPIHDVAVLNLHCTPQQAFVGQNITISINVRNEGTVTETFNVTIYANTMSIENLSVVNLHAEDDKTIIFLWNTTNEATGNYTMSATAGSLEDETDLADNTYSDGIISILSRPDIAVSEVTASKNIVGQGYTVWIDVTISNQGDYPVTFNLTVFANSTVIQTQTANVTSGSSISLTFFWNTTGFSKGCYTIVTFAWPVRDEVDTDDNTLTAGYIFVTIPGDVDGDRDVDIFDVTLIIDLYKESQGGSSQYGPNCDLDSNGSIDIHDVVIVTTHYGENW